MLRRNAGRVYRFRKKKKTISNVLTLLFDCFSTPIFSQFLFSFFHYYTKLLVPLCTTLVSKPTRLCIVFLRVFKLELFTDRIYKVYAQHSVRKSGLEGEIELRRCTFFVFVIRFQEEKKSELALCNVIVPQRVYKFVNSRP